MTARAAELGPGARPARRGGNADYFRILADFAPVMIWLATPDRKCVYFNPRWLEFTGRPLDAELGEGWMEGIHPEDRDGCTATYADAFDAWQPFEIEFRLRRRDGEYRWLLGKGVPLLFEGELSGFVGSCLDITDRLLAEREARSREQDFKRLAENIPDVIARVDRELRTLYVNPAAEHALGRKPDGLIGRRATEVGLAAQIVEPLVGAIRRTFDTGAEQRFKFESDASGARRHFAGRAMPEADGGRVEVVLVIAYDVTARAREDERRAEILARERSARASAESATLARDQFLAIVSHELRSPLNGITSWTHVLENSLHDADPGVRRALAGIMTGVEHQVRLIEDLLDMTRALSGNLRLAKQAMALLPVLAEAVETLRAAALEKGVQVAADYAIGEREIEGDHDRIRQVFVSLVANAIKSTRPGGTIRVAARTESRLACIEVRDEGAGFAPDVLPHVFDPFRQAGQGPGGRNHDGLGLGLALVQRLAELHGGHVTCESEGVDRGATFRVFLPLLPQSGASLAGVSGSSSALPSLAGIDVVLVDGERESRESVAALLAQAGARVFAAACGEEAIAQLEGAARDGPDQVIVCDIAMPGEDGYATLKRIRAWEQSRAGGAARLPAIALSAFTQREDRIRALAQGFQMHLAKPVAPAELILVIASIAHGVRV